MSIALLDGDVIAYRSCFGAERTYKGDDGEEDFTVPADLSIAKAIAHRIIDKWTRESGCQSHELFLSGANSHWRRGVFARYKSQRTEKPELFEPLREWMVDELGAKREAGLEGDDLLGIEASRFMSNMHGGAVQGCEWISRRVVCSIDKDLGTVPGWWWDAKVGGDPVFVSYRRSILEHMTQTLVGDSADNYPGCPGIGPVKAGELLGDGANRFVLWSRVVGAFEARGLDEAAALTQARISRILRWNEYQGGKVLLWSPPSQEKKSSWPKLNPLSPTFPSISSRSSTACSPSGVPSRGKPPQTATGGAERGALSPG